MIYTDDLPRELDARFMSQAELALILIAQEQASEPGMHTDPAAFYKQWFLAAMELDDDVPALPTDADDEAMGLPVGTLMNGLNDMLSDGRAELLPCRCHAAIRMHPVPQH